MSSANTLCELALTEKEASHCHISTDVIYSLPGETIQNNHLRIVIHMGKWSYLMYFHLLLLKQSSALLSSWKGVASAHTNICCHWNQLTLGQQTQDSVTICTACKEKCCSSKNHPKSCICMATPTLDTVYQMPLSQAPMWLTLNNQFDKNKQFSFSNQWS